MSFGGLSESLRYFEFELDSYDNSGAYNSGTPATDWPIFYIGGKTPLENVAAIKIVEVQIPFTWYVINSNNNTFLFTDSLTFNAIITIPVGNYTGASLATTLGTLLTAATATAFTYTVTYSSVTGKFTFQDSNSSGVANLWIMTFGPPGSSDYRSPRLILGFNEGNVSSSRVGTGPDTIVAPNVALVTGPNYVYVNSQKVGQLCNLYLPRGAVNLGNGNAGPQMAKVPVNCQPGGVIFWQDPDNTKYFDLENLPSLTEIDFYLTLGNTGQTPLPLNGGNFSMKIAILTNDFTKNDVKGGMAHEGRVVKRMRTN
jgi:hypothetical protein